METRIVKLTEDNLKDVAQEAGRLLKEGRIVAFPTDTVYGLGAVYSDKSAVNRIFEAKGRPENKPLSVLISDISQAYLLAGDIPDGAEKIMREFWPGALTVILKKNREADIPDEVTAGGDTIGIRMPDSEITISIINESGSPLAAPSANTSGKRSAAKASEVIEDLAGRIDMIIDGGDCPIGVSSTIIDMSGGNIRILREGTVTGRMIEERTGIRVKG